ncbi:hypothetical protein [Desulfosporosinus nitroreducens]|uniref:hypothetical protein n=1 Tax=Desulfosporosinus nitroreducens TaxID=2018668 RepID=UPI00207D00A5|nr:hypothetical protein [Desulfosporosinus nitroreducens]MCO1599830.1 hypothetical protein [Desulfosporosinus nitroreducens]
MPITKVSEITNLELAEYLRLEHADLTDVEKAELDTLLNVAKSFVRAYTGINDVDVSNEVVGTGDGARSVFNVLCTPVVPDSQTIYVNEVAKAEDTDYSFNDTSGAIGFKTVPVLGDAIAADYKIGLDAYADFVIVVYILVQDMYDNRTLYVDKNNLNKVVDTILGMHSINLL